MPDNVPHAVALTRLREGNARFVKGEERPAALAPQAQRESLIKGQSPFAIILSCADSRAPAELLFDQGLGDLFVVRVAGNVVAPSIVGSIEFAAATFGTQLVVVMGHTRCGAVKATIDAVAQGARAPTENIHDIVDRISPSVHELAKHLNGDELLKAVTRANVRASASHLRHASRVLEQFIAQGKVHVVGAEYSLETGVVDFFDVPEARPQTRAA